MPQDISLSDIKDLIGKELGVSDWITVTQQTIDRFAEATSDFQFIHTDPVRAAAETPFAGTIAHGSLAVAAFGDELQLPAQDREQTMA